MTETEKQPEKQMDPLLAQLIENVGGNPKSYEGQLVAQIMESSLKLLSGDYSLGEMKVINRSIREMRHAYGVFNRYQCGPCVSIFGSARTPEDHPDYLAAREFSSLISQHGWMCITGGANGIMKGGLEGAKKEMCFGLSILLPFESSPNILIDGDPKSMFFRFFFTRKLMFMSHSNALAAFPGGFGTLDELFEMLTLIQTGKANIIPIVLIEGKNGSYWEAWQKYMKEQLLDNNWICPEDIHLYYLAPSPEEAMQHILKFYSCYNSSRYVDDLFVIRLNRSLSENQLKYLNREFKSLVAEGEMRMSDPLPNETDQLELPRLVFRHTKSHFGKLRLLIDAINDNIGDESNGT